MSEQDKNDITEESLPVTSDTKAADEPSPAPTETEKAETEVREETDDGATQDDAPTTDKKAPESAPARPADNIFDFTEILTLTLAAVLLITCFFFRHSVVDGNSMEQTLRDRDQLILFSAFYTPEAGDIIVFEDYGTGHRKPLVKRVIATAGQTVTVLSDTEYIVDGVFYSDGYTDPYRGPSGYSYPIICTVSEGCLFVMGDHRNDSSDSRAFGEISEESVLGKVVLRIYPFSSFGVPK